jgi:hypothetical protein
VEVDSESEEVQEKSTTIEAMVQVRYRLAHRGRADLLGLGAAGVTQGSALTDPDGTDNDTITKMLAFGVAWGAGIEWFATENWSVSVDGTNTLVELATVSVEEEAFETDTTITSNVIGVAWDPTIRLMTHLYF